MEKFEGYDGIVPDQRWKNEVLWHLRRQTELLEKLIDAGLKKEGEENVSVSTKRVSKRGTGERQQRQRRSNSTRKRSE